MVEVISLVVEDQEELEELVVEVMVVILEGQIQLEQITLVVAVEQTA